jgi:HEAT repeat protein
MPLRRSTAGTSSGAAPPPADLAKTLHALTHGTDDERWSAARAAGELAGSAAALGEALTRESNPRVREVIFTSLVRIATAESVEAVLPFLRSDDASIRGAALDALAAMKDVTRPYLAALLRDDSRDVRILTCDLVRNIPSADAVQLFDELLESEQDPNVCATAIDALAEIGRPEALPTLARCAERFRAIPFLAYSIKIATDRIRLRSSEPRA